MLWVMEDSTFSIHALLAESDVEYIPPEDQSSAFLSTLSLRRATPQGEYTLYGRILFYPRSPCGERLVNAFHGGDLLTFLSTLSLRRATISK